MKTWSKDATLKDIYEPAMEIKCRSKADEYFEALVQHNMKSGNSREKARERGDGSRGKAGAGHQGEELMSYVSTDRNVMVKTEPGVIVLCKFKDDGVTEAKIVFSSEEDFWNMLRGMIGLAAYLNAKGGAGEGQHHPAPEKGSERPPGSLSEVWGRERGSAPGDPKQEDHVS